MSRIFRLAAALSALVALVAVPGALAKSTHKHHPRAHHRSATKSDKTTVKTNEHTSSEHPGGSTTPSGDSGDSHPTPTPPAPPADAGTVVSFTDGVLTITLTGGGTLTGAVPPGTPVICRPVNHTRTDAPATGDHHEPTPTTTTPTTTTPPPPPPATTPAPPAPPVATACGTAALVHGAVVHEAGLGLGPNGLRFTSIILVQA